MTSKWALVAGIGVLAAVTVSVVIAQEKLAKLDGETPQRQADEAAVREASQAFARAFEKGDAKAIGAFFTEEGEYVDEDGKPIQGRAALKKAYESFFAKRPELKVESKADAVRFVGKDAAVENGTFTVRAKNSPPDSSRYSTLYVRQDGRWLMALLKEWRDETTGRPSLQNLAWLIGTWESEGTDLKARTTYAWAENQKFIRARFTITPKKEGERPSSGTQVIGLDPVSGIIRAWVFDADGGIGESSWTWDGERWIIDSAGTLADGSETTAQNFLTRTGDDTFTWRSAKRTLNSDSLPDLGTVKVKRVAGEK
jgi:uncharacterized protein (TIGR02246 family)